MSTELIAEGSTAATSADFTLAEGEKATIFLAAAAGVKWTSKGVVEIKKSAGVYSLAGRLGQGLNAVQIEGPGDFRGRRFAGEVSFGMFRG